MRVLVTGHNGYLGSVLVPVLVGAGHDVVGLDTFFFEECSLGGEQTGVPTIRKDIRDVGPSDLLGIAGVVHLAALSDGPLGDLRPESTYDINHLASLQLARIARDAGVQRFLFASSCSLYRANGAEDLVTEESPREPTTAYAISKARAEDDIAGLATAAFSPVFMRNATPYGLSPRLRADFVLNDLVCRAHATGRVPIVDDGSSWWPIVHVQDIARAFAVALTAPRAAVHNQAFNVGAKDENYQLRELAEIVRGTVAGCTVEYAEGVGPAPRSHRVDFSKLARALPDFAPQWNASFGAKDLYAALQEANVTPADFHGPRFLRLARLSQLLDRQLLDDRLRWMHS
jgi:nucleoside-diphosphate-sugar epimerase